MWTAEMQRALDLVIEHVGPVAHTRLEAHGAHWYWIVALPGDEFHPVFSGTFQQCRDIDIRYSNLRDDVQMAGLMSHLYPNACAMAN